MRVYFETDGRHTIVRMGEIGEHRFTGFARREDQDAFSLPRGIAVALLKSDRPGNLSRGSWRGSIAHGEFTLSDEGLLYLMWAKERHGKAMKALGGSPSLGRTRWHLAREWVEPYVRESMNNSLEGQVTDHSKWNILNMTSEIYA